MRGAVHGGSDVELLKHLLFVEVGERGSDVVARVLIGGAEDEVELARQPHALGRREAICSGHDTNPAPYTIQANRPPVINPFTVV